MKCVVFDRPGNVENLRICSLPVPRPAAGEVLIRTYCFGINPIDIKTRSGKGLYGQLSGHSFIIPGWDICGEVIETGPECQKLKKGDIVFGMINFPGYGQAYAEYVAAPEAHLSIKPENISAEEACGASLAALTAWQALVRQAAVKSGQTVLIHAAAGGVGHFAVQIASYSGASVYGTSSEKNLDFIASLGVNHPVDYKKQPIENLPEAMDIIIDPLGGTTTSKSVRLLNKGGILVSLVAGVTDEIGKLADELAVRAINYRVSSSGNDMDQLASLLRGKSLKTHISGIYSLNEVQDAHRQIESGRTVGKIVVKIV